MILHQFWIRTELRMCSGGKMVPRPRGKLNPSKALELTLLQILQCIRSSTLFQTLVVIRVYSELQLLHRFYKILEPQPFQTP